MGEEAPAEHIIASIVAGAGAYTLPLLVPFIHRFGRRTIVRATLLCTMATAVAIAAFSARSPFDEMHQKRVFVIHMENVGGSSSAAANYPPTEFRLRLQVTTQEQHLHVAAADGAPGFPQLAQRIAEEWSVPGAVPTPMSVDAWNNDWDVIYPFSAVSVESAIPSIDTARARTRARGQLTRDPLLWLRSSSRRTSSSCPSSQSTLIRLIRGSSFRRPMTRSTESPARGASPWWSDIRGLFGQVRTAKARRAYTDD